MPTTPIPKKRLGQLLVEAGVIDNHQLRSALGYQRQWGGKLGHALVSLRLASEPQIVAALATKLGFEVARLDELQRSPALDAALKLVPREVARRHNVLPLAADLSSVTLAMSDPTNLAITDEISFRTGRRVRIALAGDREVSRAITRLYFPETDPETRALEFDEDDGPVRAPDPSEGLPEHLQERFFPSTLRDLGAARAAPAVATRSPTPLASGPQPGTSATPAGSPSHGRESALRDAIDRMAAGEDAPRGIQASRLVAALAKALLRRGLVTEAELLVELSRR